MEGDRTRFLLMSMSFQPTGEECFILQVPDCLLSSSACDILYLLLRTDLYPLIPDRDTAVCCFIWSEILCSELLKALKSDNFKIFVGNGFYPAQDQIYENVTPFHIKCNFYILKYKFEQFFVIDFKN